MEILPAAFGFAGTLIGALVAATATRAAQSKALSAAKAAQDKAEEREATAIIAQAAVQAREEALEESSATDWSRFGRDALTPAEVAVFALRDAELRERVDQALRIARHAAADEAFLEVVNSSRYGVVNEASREVLVCLGANLRGEELPPASMIWTRFAAEHQLEEEAFAMKADEEEQEHRERLRRRRSRPALTPEQEQEHARLRFVRAVADLRKWLRH
ncbi:hypothetical protein [Streptomyces sp. NPDC053048]|uniref:hypothetical protein n=1 Tax=Streptomyces sp. NPDC053048 TaxID=3365694 RepID=UPI0037D7212D